MATDILRQDRLTLIDVFEEIDSTLPEVAVTLPKCVFLGPQSCGKSSLISKITTLPLHVDCGTTTRCPTEIRTKVHECDPEFKVTIRVVEDTDGHPVPIKEFLYQDWEPTSIAGYVLKKANLEAMFPTLRGGEVVGFDASSINDLSPDDVNNKASHNVVIVEARGRTFQDITVVDLPGIKSTDVGPSAIRKLAESYAEKANVLIVSCHSGDSEYGNQPAAPIALKCDPSSQRTLNVLNKADRLAVENTTYSDCFPSLNNWFATCGNEDIAKETSLWHEGAVQKFFQDTPQERLGQANLIRAIQLRMDDMRLDSLPKWERRIEDLCQKASENTVKAPFSVISPMEECGRLIVEFEIKCKKVLVLGAQRRIHPEFNRIQKHLQELDRSLKKAVPCFFGDHFDHVTPAVRFYEEEISKVCQTHTEGGNQDSILFTAVIQELLARSISPLKAALQRAIQDLWTVVRDAMDNGLGDLGKQTFASQMGRRISSELRNHEKEMKRTADRAVQGLIACGQAYLNHGKMQVEALQSAYQQRGADRATPPGSPVSGTDDITEKTIKEVMMCVALQTMATSMITAGKLAAIVQVDFLSHLGELVESVGEVLRDECELTKEQPEPASRKRKLEMLMDNRSLADKERSKKAQEDYERLNRLHKRVRTVLADM